MSATAIPLVTIDSITLEFGAGPDSIKLALYARKALAKDAGIAPDGGGSHRIAIASAAGLFTDPDGFSWEAPTAT